MLGGMRLKFCQQAGVADLLRLLCHTDRPNNTDAPTDAARQAGSHLLMLKDFTPELEWIKAAASDGSAHQRKRDTLTIGATKVRLEGIDAPETDQVCLNANGNRWTCGIDARDQLAAHIRGRATSCSPNGTDAINHSGHA